MAKPIELVQIEAAWTAAYQTLLPPQAHGNAQDKKRNFLSRAQAAFILEKEARLAPHAAAAAVVDASADGGIDAVHVDTASRTIWLIQSKYIESGAGEPDLAGVLKFLEGIQNILRGEFLVVQKNAFWAALIPAVKAAVESSEYSVRCVIVYSSFQLLGDDRKLAIEKVLGQINKSHDICEIKSANLATVHGYLLESSIPAGVSEVQLFVHNPSIVKYPYRTYLGRIRACDLVELSKSHGESLVVSNIRRYKGNTEVNSSIVKTAIDAPDLFFYLNNGITAYCNKIEVPVQNQHSDPCPLKAKGFSIINGAQTLGSLAKAAEKTSIDEKCFVAIKIISLERSEDDIELSKEITRSSNFQNSIGMRDFVALDDQQSALAASLILSGVKYHFRDAAGSPPADLENFSFDEAIVALACAEQEIECDLLARVLSNKRSLYSFEVSYTGRIYSSRYERLFPATRSATRIWRSVQVYRQVFSQLLDDARASIGIRRSFFENCRPLVLNVVYLKTEAAMGDQLMLTSAEESSIRAKATEYAEMLWTVAQAKGFVSSQTTPTTGEVYQQARSFQSVFRSASDCEALRTGLLASI